MRLTLPLSILRPISSASPLSLSPWLSTLKTKQLQQIAQKTGLPSSGTKPVLIAGLENGLAPYCSPNVKGKRKEMLSIISIDMGIRNLAFAHLRCDPSINASSSSSSSSSSLPSSSSGMGDAAKGKNEKTVVLNSWRRISLPFSRAFTAEEFERYLDTPLDVSQSPSQSESGPGTGSACALDSEEVENPPLGKKQTARKKNKKEMLKEKESFSLPIYAEHAHSILTTLLRRYNPTHILIERQRFRSGSGAAVQEWSLRVGVFEGMLWAVLGSLRAQAQTRFQGVSRRDVLGDENRHEGEGKGECERASGPAWPAVVSIEPGRVGRYWMPQGASVSEIAVADTKPKKKPTNREGKKVKVDLVGSWLESGSLAIGDDGVQPWVDGYMLKWKKEKPIKAKSKPERQNSGNDATDVDGRGGAVDIGKIDDLADCVVQGMTWLEWEGMRERVVKEQDDAAGLGLP